MDNHTAQIKIPTDVGDLKSLPLMLDVETARQIPGCSDRYMRDMCEKKKVKAVKLGRVWRINRDSLLEFCGLA